MSLPLKFTRAARIDPPGIDDWLPREWCLTEDIARKLHVGRKLIASGKVVFGYYEKGIRRGAVYALYPHVEEVYFIGLRMRWEGVVKPGSGGYPGIDGYVEAEGPEWHGKKQVLVLQVRRTTESPIYEVLPQQAAFVRKTGC